MSDTSKVVRVKIKDLIPDIHNANRGNERGRYMIGRSVEKHGAGRGIALDRNLRIVAGNKTVEALADAGIEEILLVRTDGNTLVATVREDWDLDDPKTGARDYAYADNRAAIDIEFDPAVIAFDLGEGLDLSDWWQPAELELLTADIDGGAGDTADAEPQTSRADELREEWGTETGQLWRLPSRTTGQFHLLSCGDCTDRAVVERVMMGEKAAAVITDPPYGVDYGGGSGNEKQREMLAGDSNTNLYRLFLATCLPHKGERAAVYVWFAGSQGRAVYDAVEDSGLTVRSLLFWNKINAHYGGYMAQ